MTTDQLNQLMNLLALINLFEMMVAIGLGVTFADVLLVTKDWKLELSALSAPPGRGGSVGVCASGKVPGPTPSGSVLVGRGGQGGFVRPGSSPLPGWEFSNRQGPIVRTNKPFRTGGKQRKGSQVEFNPLAVLCSCC